MTDGIEMPRALSVSRFDWQTKRRINEQLGVATRDTAAAFLPIRQMLQLHAEHRALNSLHAIVVADFVVVITLRRTVFTQRAGAGGERGVVGHERATFAARAEIFRRIKTEAGN